MEDTSVSLEFAQIDQSFHVLVYTRANACAQREGNRIGRSSFISMRISLHVAKVSVRPTCIQRNAPANILKPVLRTKAIECIPCRRTPLVETISSKLLIFRDSIVLRRGFAESANSPFFLSLPPRRFLATVFSAFPDTRWNAATGSWLLSAAGIL